MSVSPSGVTCWATPTPSSTWTSGAGRVSSRTSWARAHGTNSRILKRLVDEISARPAAQRAVALKDKHKFKTEMDSEALNAMVRHLTEKVA